MCAAGHAGARGLIQSNAYIKLSTVGRHNTAVKWRSNWSTLIWYKSWNHGLYRNVSDFVSQRGRFCSSRNLLSRFGHELLETIPPTVVFIRLSIHRSFTGTNRVLTIRRSGVHSPRGGIPGEDLLLVLEPRIIQYFQ